MITQNNLPGSIASRKCIFLAIKYRDSKQKFVILPFVTYAFTSDPLLSKEHFLTVGFSLLAYVEDCYHNKKLLVAYLEEHTFPKNENYVHLTLFNIWVLLNQGA